MRAIVTICVILLLIAGFLATQRDEPETVTVHAHATTTTTWPTETLPTLPASFDQLVIASRKPPQRARTAPRHRAVVRAAAAGSVPDLIRRVFARFGAGVAEQAVRVSGCETGHTYDPTVVNASGHTGLFQLSRRYHEPRAQRLGFTWEQMRKAEPNAIVAADLYAEQGWGPWTCRYAA